MAEDRILVGVISAAHGLRGEVRVKSFMQDPLGLSSYSLVWTEAGRALSIARVALAGKALRVKFVDVDDRDAAEALRGTQLFLARDMLSDLPEDDYYHADLLGCRVCDGTGVELGTITAIHDFGAGDLLEFGPYLVPFTQDHVPQIDIKLREVVVNLPVDADVEVGEEEKL